MKKKIMLFFIIFTIFVLALVSYKFTKGTDQIVSKIRSSGALNNLIIEKIQTSTSNTDSIEEITVSLRTEWNGLYLESLGNTSNLTDADKKEMAINTLKEAITKEVITGALIPIVDEVIPETDINVTEESDSNASFVKARQYVVINPKNTTPLFFTAENFTSESGQVFEVLDSSAKYDFVFVVEANTPATDSNIKTALSTFTNYLSEKNYDYKTNIIEIGGKKAIYQPVSGTTTYNLYDAMGTSKIDLSNNDNSSLTPTTYNLLFSNMDKTKVAYPQDVSFADVKYPTTTNSEFFLQKYTTWLSSQTNIEAAISLIGKYNLSGSFFKTSPGSNGLYGLYEAVNFLKSNKDTTRKQVIVYIGNKEMNADISTVKEIPQFSTSSFSNDSEAKTAFISWFNNEVLINNFLVLNSSPLSNSATLDGNPYNITDIDRLGHAIVETYNKTDNKLYLLELKPQLLEKLFEYESGSNQVSLKDVLYNFIGWGRYYQTWIINFTNTNPVTDKWKKLLFSLGDFKINYDDDSADNPYVVTTTILKKPINEADQYFYPGKSADILAINSGEKYYDRYYYTNSNPTIITFTGPDENNPIWYPNSQQMYTLKFNFSKLNTSNKLPDGTALTSLKLLVKNGSNTVINKIYTRTDIIQNETASGGWGLTETKDKYLVTIYFSDSEFSSMQEATKKSRNYYLNFDVTGTINNELVQKSVTSYVDILGPEIAGSATAQNQTAKDILKALDIFKNDPLEDEYITALTSADSDGYLYLRNGTDSDITFNFTIYDENPSGDTVKYYDNVIHAKIASNFIGQHIVTTYDIDPTNKYVDVDITGELKTDTIIRNIEIQDSFGNKSVVRVIDATPVFLSDPVPLTVNLVTEQINDYTSDSTVDISPKIFVKGGTRDNYDLVFNNSAFASGKIVGLLFPFTQDISKVDTPTSGTITYFGRAAKSDLNYETFKSASNYPTPTNLINVSGYLDTINILSRNNLLLYDGIYGAQSVLPVNRAGGIAGLEYDFSLSNAYANADSNAAKLSSPITALKYIVDTIPPKFKSIYKTGVIFKDNVFTYENITNFMLDTTTKQLDSGYTSITYQDSVFTGLLSKGIKAKPDDIYTVVLDDVSLSTKNINPGTITAPVSTLAKNKFYTYKINTDNNISAEDLAGNNITNIANIGTIISSYPIINEVTFGLSVEGFDNLYFTNDKTNLLFNNSDFSASTLVLNDINYLGQVSSVRDIPIPNTSFETNGEKVFKNYAFDLAGWVKTNTLTFVYDNDINTTSTELPRIIFNKIASKTWEGQIDFANIYEYAGIKEFSLSNYKANSVTVSDTNFFVKSSNTISRTISQITVPNNEKKIIKFIYSGDVPPYEIVNVEITDKLGNKKTFTVRIELVNTLKIIGTSSGTDKQKETNIIITDYKVDIKATKDGIK